MKCNLGSFLIPIKTPLILCKQKLASTNWTLLKLFLKQCKLWLEKILNFHLISVAKICTVTDIHTALAGRHTDCLWSRGCSGVCNTLTSTLPSLSKLISDVSSTCLCVCVPSWLFVWERERRRLRKGKRRYDWVGTRQRCAVSSGLRRKAAPGQMTSFQPAFHIPASLLATKHIIISLTK